MVMCKLIHVILVLLSSLALTQCQVIPGGSCDVKTMAENDVLMKIRELTLEVSSCKEKSLETERLLYDVTSRLTKTETQFATYRNESHEKQRELESQHLGVSARLIRTETEFSNYRNESHEKLRELESELQMIKDQLKAVKGILRPTGKHIRKFWSINWLGLNTYIAFIL